MKTQSKLKNIKSLMGCVMKLELFAFTFIVNCRQTFKQCRKFFAQKNHDNQGFHHWQGRQYLNEHVQSFIQINRHEFDQESNARTQKTNIGADNEYGESDVSGISRVVRSFIVCMCTKPYQGLFV